MPSELPPWRPSTTIGINYADVEGLRLKAWVTYSRGEDGRIVEAFVTSGKPGSPAEATLRDGGLMLSLLLQHGMTLTAVQAALTRGAQGLPGSQLGVIVDRLVEEEALANG